ncbi:hypothetical protein HPB49_004811 [Dermacentor silvarum]|uniref:Uncharacterized protein n=1 Tax=Dermacentor silvarum TaxID=543639 RepID=A0ACB8DUA5_DERSI|nr:hypothetical protein HPB49_004811 [Dermacentor silvarum]
MDSDNEYTAAMGRQMKKKMRQMSSEQTSSNQKSWCVLRVYSARGGWKKRKSSSEEHAVLLELISRHRSVVENKKTDSVSVSRKRESWKKVEDEFNCRHNVAPRT